MEMTSLSEFIQRAGSIAEAARQLDLPYITLWRWVHGKTSPSREMRRMLTDHGINRS